MVPDEARKEAKAAGLTFYFNGKPCSKGHIAERYVSTHQCRECVAAFQLANLEKARAKRAIEQADQPLSPRKQAIADGKSRYFTGKPCPRGHMAELNTCDGSCVECRREARIAKERNSEKPKLRRQAYLKANAERYRAHTRNRRAKAKGNSGSHTQDDVEAIFRAQKGRCAYCRVKLRHWHVDHIVPISAGGSNDRRNIQLTCKTCNLRKHNKHPIAFAKITGRLL